MNRKWTVLFFIHEVSEYVQHVRDLFDELCDLPYLRQTNVLFVYDKIQGRKRITTLNALEYDSRAGKNKVVLLRELKGFNMSDGEDWRKIMTSVKTEFPASRYMVYTWGHGSIFGIVKKRSMRLTDETIAPVQNGLSFYKDERFNLFYQDFKDTKGLVPLTPLEVLAIKSYFIRKGFLDLLWISELSMAIAKAFGKVDVLIMMNCGMQSFENGYDLRECVELLIAPETNMSFDGYPYRAIIEKIDDEPLITADDFSDYTKDAYVKRYVDEGPNGVAKLEDTTFFANQLKNYDTLFTYFERIANVLLPQIKDNSLDFSIVRDGIFPLSYSTIVDVSTMLEELNSVVAQPALKKESSRLTAAITGNTVLSSYVGPVYKFSDPRGVSICFPDVDIRTNRTIVEALLYFHKIHPSTFIQKSTWVKVLEEYLKRL